MVGNQSLFEAADAFYPRMGEYVNGFLVADEIDNAESIEATFNNWGELEGIREVPLNLFDLDALHSADDQRKAEELAEKISESGTISPLIVVVDSQGVNNPYILEGSHRAAALSLLGTNSLPALIVVDFEADSSTTGQPPYEEFKQRLESSRKVLIPSLFIRRECDLSEDPDWPAPKTEYEAGSLLWRLPSKSHIICALVAAELALPVWAQEYPEDGRPVQAVQVAWEWLGGKLSLEEVERASEGASAAEFYAVYSSAPSAVVNSAAAARSAMTTIWHPATSRQGAENALRHARTAIVEARWMGIEEFYELWWKECRCALAIDKPGRVEPTTGQPPYEEFKQRIAPTSKTYIPSLFIRRECDPPDDPEWPTPTNREDCEVLLSRLPLNSQVICALTAAELVLPILNDIDREALEEASPNANYLLDIVPATIVMAQRWLEGTLPNPRESLPVALGETLNLTDAFNNLHFTQPWPLRPAEIFIFQGVVYAASYLIQTLTPDLSQYIGASTTPRMPSERAASLAVQNAAYAASRTWGISEDGFYKLWWKECRCRLALDRPEAQELTTGSILSELPRIPARSQLEDTKRKTYIPSLFTRRECDPPEDPEWPTPTNREEAEALLKRLPHRSQVICALTAAELVLPIWEEQWEPGSPDIDLRPKEAIEVTWRWLEGEASLEEVHEAENAAGTAWAARAAAWAARAAAGAAWAARAAAGAAWAAARAAVTAWWAAVAAEEAGWMTQKEFYDLWWKECRCRLALDRPEAQELTTGSILSELPRIPARSQLEDTKRKTYIPSLFTRRKCDPPEDPEWPTPQNRTELDALLSKFDINRNRKWVLCAWVACDLVVPIWRETIESAPGMLDKPLQVLRGIVDRTSSDEDIQAAIPTTAQAQHVAGDQGQAAAEAAARSLQFALGIMGSVYVGTASEAIKFASWAADFSGWMEPRAFVNLWWKRCRCALAIDKPESTELTTGQPSYEDIREHLEHPEPKTILPELYHRELTPCDPPDDPEWPAPITVQEVGSLLDRLPHRSQIICALTAAELVLPIWEESTEIDLRPREAIETTWKWLNGEATLAEVLDSAQEAEEASEEAGWASLAWASALASANAAGAVEDPVRAERAIEVATLPAKLAGIVNKKEEFYDLWWKECRCRLAVDRPEHVEME